MNLRVKKIPMNNYEAYFYKTDMYTSIHINLIFEMDYTKENIYNLSMLTKYMVETNKIYKTKKDISDRCKELYSPNFGITNYNYGLKLITEIEFTMFDPKKIGNDYFKETIDFFKNILYKPNFENQKLDRDVIEKIKNVSISDFVENLNDPETSSSREFKKAYLKNTYEFIDFVETRKEYENMVNNITDKDLINTYDKLINDSFVGMTIMGNLDSEYLTYIKNTFTFKKVNKLTKELNKLNKIERNKDVTIKDDKIKESTIKIIYYINNYKKEDYFAYKALLMMLNYDSGRLLHQILRDKEKLVYSSYARFNENFKIITFTAKISSLNKDKTIKVIEELIEMLKDTTLLKNELLKVKEKVNYNSYVSDENKWNVISELYERLYKFYYTEKTYTNKMNALSENDLLNALLKLERSGVFFYEGTKE